MNAKEFSEGLGDFATDVARIDESIPDTRVGRHIAGQLILKTAVQSAESRQTNKREDVPHMACFTHRVSSLICANPFRSFG